MNPPPKSGITDARYAGLIRPRVAINVGLVVLLIFIPVYAAATGDAFALTLFTRVVILAMAALSLNLIMGFGGMVSFGHAAYLGIGGYAVGILAKEGIGSGFVQWPVAVAASAALLSRIVTFWLDLPVTGIAAYHYGYKALGLRANYLNEKLSAYLG